MASFTLTRVDLFPNGTTIHVHPRPAQGVPSSGAPSTTELTSGVMTSGTVTFSGLADAANYVAYASSPDRYLSFRTPVATAAATDAAARKQALWYPTGQGSAASGSVFPTNVIDQVGDRGLLNTSQALSSGGMRLSGNLMIPSGVTCTGGVVYIAASASGPTHSFMILVDQALNVLAKSADKTTTALTANTWIPYDWTAPYVASADIAVYAGFVQTSTTTQASVSVLPGTLTGLPNQVPRWGIQTPGTTTVPADIGSTVTVSSVANAFWAALYT